MNQPLSLIDLTKVYLRWKKPILVFVAISTITAVVVSLMLPNYYESKAVFYPSNPALTDRQMLFNDKGSDIYLDYFGSKNDVNRMLAIAYSNPVIDYMIENFKLQEHYEIDTTDKLWVWKTRKEFLSNYRAIKNELGALEVTIEDRDRFVASDMTDAIVYLIDKFNKDMILKNKLNILSIYRVQLEGRQKEVKVFADSLAGLRVKYQITELESPDGQIILVTGNDPNAVELFKILLRKQYNSIKDLNQIQTIYDQYTATLHDDFSTVFIVESAYPAEKKKRPVRWLICLSAFLVSAFLGMAGALIAERVNEIRQELKHD